MKLGSEVLNVYTTRVLLLEYSGQFLGECFPTFMLGSGLQSKEYIKKLLIWSF